MRAPRPPCNCIDINRRRGDPGRTGKGGRSAANARAPSPRPRIGAHTPTDLAHLAGARLQRHAHMVGGAGVDSPMISPGDSDSATAEMGIKLPRRPSNDAHNRAHGSPPTRTNQCQWYQTPRRREIGRLTTRSMVMQRAAGREEVWRRLHIVSTIFPKCLFARICACASTA